MTTCPQLDRIYLGDCIETMRSWPDEIVQTCVTSPPYFGLRDYGHDGQIGLEDTPEAFVAKMVEVFREVRRLLRKDGTLWLNLGDSYNAAGRDGHGSRENCKQGTNRASAAGNDKRRPSAANLKPKDLIGIPWSVAFALRADGWYLRQDIIWAKPNPMPESVTDRCTKSHEYIFLLSKSDRYFYDAAAIKEKASESSFERMDQNVEAQAGSDRVPGKTNGTMKAVLNGETRNKRSVWTVNVKGFDGAHFATFPEELIAPCILAGAARGGVILDPFMGAGTTALVASRYDRRFLGCELNPEYKALAERRIASEVAQQKLF